MSDLIEALLSTHLGNATPRAARLRSGLPDLDILMAILSPISGPAHLFLAANHTRHDRSCLYEDQLTLGHSRRFPKRGRFVISVVDSGESALFEPARLRVWTMR
jgi:hypothetical protein